MVALELLARHLSCHSFCDCATMPPRLEPAVWMWIIEADGSFEKEEAVIYAHTCDRKIILLFEMGTTHSRTAYHCWCHSEVWPLHLHKLHPHTKDGFILFYLINLFVILLTNPLSKLTGRLEKDAFGKQGGTKVIRKQEEAEVGTGTKNGQKHGLSYTKSHKDCVE